MAKIFNMQGKEIKHIPIPKEQLSAVFLQLSSVIHNLISNHQVFQNLISTCNHMPDEDLKKIIKKNMDSSVKEKEIDVLVTELRGLLKIYIHISPILSLYVNKIPSTIISSTDNGLIH